MAKGKKAFFKNAHISGGKRYESGDECPPKLAETLKGYGILTYGDEPEEAASVQTADTAALRDQLAAAEAKAAELGTRVTELESQLAAARAKAGGGQTGTALADDFPWRGLLVDGGFESLEKVKAASDDELLAIEDLGPARLKEVRKAHG